MFLLLHLLLRACVLYGLFFTSQDIQEFLVDNFDHKVWVNKVLQSDSSGPNIETETLSVVLNLQRMLETANQDVETIFHEVAQVTPRILRDIESVNQQAILLKDHMDSVESDFRKMHIDDNGIIRELERLDCERQRAKKAADALREANRWSMLVNSHQALMEGDANVDQLYHLIVDMEQSLVYMEQMPDYANRKALLSSTKDRLETLVAPQFMELLDAITQSKEHALVESLEHLISIFCALDRSSVAVRYYVTWLTNQMKDHWENSGYYSMDSSPPADPAFLRVQRFLYEVIVLISDQLQFKLFKENPEDPLLKALIVTLESISPEINQTLFIESDSFNKRLSRCEESFKLIQNIADQLCCLLSFGNDSKLEIYFKVARGLCAPLVAVSETFKSYATENLQEVLHFIKQYYTDETLLQSDLQLTSDRLLKQLDDLLNSAVVQTRGIALPSLLDAIHHVTKTLITHWNNTLEAFANHLIEEDREMKYEQARGMNVSLSLVALTGAFSSRVTDFVKRFDRQLARVFLNSEEHIKACSNARCPFHSLLLPLIGESQPCADWSVLLPLAPQTDWLKVPISDSFEPIAPDQVLLHRLGDLCKSAVAMAQRVALTPVNDILAVVPKMSIWTSNPVSGEATLPDLAYLPQEYITQLGQYIFNLPEHLLPFMDTNEGAASTTTIDQSVSLVHCLRYSDPCKSQGQSTTVTPGNRSQLPSSSSAESVPSPTMITTWLDWLLSGQVAEAFVKVILEIPSPLQAPGNCGKSVPGLTAHGAKQLVTDLDYFLGLLEELGLPQPGDLACLRDLLRATPEEFKKMSPNRSPRLVAGVINLRML